LRWEEQGFLQSVRDENGNRYYRRHHVLVAKRVSDQWRLVRQRHREHLRKLPAIQKKIELFIRTKPLERTKDPEPLNLSEMREAFQEMREWEAEHKEIQELYQEFYTGEILRYAKRLAKGIEAGRVQAI